MAVFGEVDDKPIISMSPGRHFDERVMYEVQEELARQNWASISHTYDVDAYLDAQGNLKYNKIADHAKKRDKAVAATGASSSIEFGWSWGAGPAIWPNKKVPVAKIILAAGAFHPNVVAFLGEDTPETVHSIHYAAFEPQSAGGTLAAEELLRNCIINTITDEEIILNWAKKIRSHPRVEDESQLSEPPTAPIDYIILKKDKAVLNQDDTRDADGLVIEEGIATKLSKNSDVTKIWFDSDHGPMISKSKKCAHLIVQRAAAVVYQPNGVS